MNTSPSFYDYSPLQDFIDSSPQHVGLKISPVKNLSVPKTKIESRLKGIVWCSFFYFLKGSWKVGVNRPIVECNRWLQEPALLEKFKAVAESKLEI